MNIQMKRKRVESMRTRQVWTRQVSTGLSIRDPSCATQESSSEDDDHPCGLPPSVLSPFQSTLTSTHVEQGESSTGTSYN